MGREAVERDEEEVWRWRLMSFDRCQFRQFFSPFSPPFSNPRLRRCWTRPESDNRTNRDVVSQESSVVVMVAVAVVVRGRQREREMGEEREREREREFTQTHFGLLLLLVASRAGGERERSH
ncbi:hypothetical protein IE53DRAFT_39654 [Violaceomyces palustris]|uniref:Uncharacterized protein n=1 Tax=Violaceomyces palustris TaxID=1673888 RepID=A0ACD0P0X4_9BASI|nr:hypothetical protein IE53DRAFT_39654 [Violaceomyces palustris]